MTETPEGTEGHSRFIVDQFVDSAGYALTDEIRENEARAAELAEQVNTLVSPHGERVSVSADEPAGQLISEILGLEHQHAELAGMRERCFGRAALRKLGELDNQRYGVIIAEWRQDGIVKLGNHSLLLPKSHDTAEGKAKYESARAQIIDDARQDLAQRANKRGTSVTSKLQPELQAVGAVAADTEVTPEVIEGLSDEQMEHFLFYHMEKFEADRDRFEALVPEFEEAFLTGASRLIIEGTLPITEEQLISRSIGHTVVAADYLDEFDDAYGDYRFSTGRIRMEVGRSREDTLHTYVHERLHSVQERQYDWQNGRVYDAFNTLSKLEAEFFGQNPPPAKHEGILLRHHNTEAIVDDRAAEISGKDVIELSYFDQYLGLKWLDEDEQKLLTDLAFAHIGTVAPEIEARVMDILEKSRSNTLARRLRIEWGVLQDRYSKLGEEVPESLTNALFDFFTNPN